MMSTAILKVNSPATGCNISMEAVSPKNFPTAKIATIRITLKTHTSAVPAANQLNFADFVPRATNVNAEATNKNPNKPFAPEQADAT
ncbi:unannotated protein [freshwater metagenome]|uniref:Unannotated protein n=1 Tax=freshwater metagenome TaxID=449393 RepID=A0A6J6D6M9_9ZZZZ